VGDPALGDGVVVVAPAVLRCSSNSAVRRMGYDPAAISTEEGGRPLANVSVLLALVWCALAVVVLGVAVGWAHRLVVAVVRRGADVAVALEVVVVLGVALQERPTRALAERGRVCGDGGRGARSGARAVVDDCALVEIVVALPDPGVGRR